MQSQPSTGNQVMEGLGTYQLYKIGFGIVIMIIAIIVLIYFIIINYNKNFISTQDCNIKPNAGDKSQTVTYKVNNVVYTKNIPPITKTTNDVQTTEYANPEGPCTIFYSRDDPNIYNIGSDPTTVFGIIAGILCVILILTIIWYNILRSDKSLAGVMGGIDVASSLVGKRR